MNFLRDLGHAVRSLGRSPLLSAALIATVAVGIGTRAALTGFTNGLVAVDLAPPAAQRVVTAAPADAVAIDAPRDRPASRSTASADEAEIASKIAQVRRVLRWASALVLIAAAANVGGFLLSRAWRRAPETVTRVALGATRAHLVSRILADSLVICAAGSAVGGLVGFWTAGAFPALLFAEDAGRLHFAPSAARTAAGVLIYAALMILAALTPILRMHHDRPLSILRRSGGPQVTSPGSLRTALAIVQMAICCVLVIGGAFLVEGLRESLRTARGARVGQPVVAIVEASDGYRRPDLGEAYFRRAEAQLLQVLGVIGVERVSAPPGARTSAQTMTFEAPPDAYREVSIPTAVLQTGRELKRLKLTRGRLFGGGDDRFSCRVAVVNEAAERELFAGDALGRSLSDTTGRRIDIVGVLAVPPEAGTEPAVFLFDRQLDPPLPDGEPRSYRLAQARASSPADTAVAIASAGYFGIVGARVTEGEMFGAAGAEDGCDEAVVNREAAEAFFHGRAAGGAVIDPSGHRARVTGVVDAGVLRVTQRESEPTVFFPPGQHYVPRMTLIASAGEAPPAMLQDMQRRLRAAGGGAVVGPVLTLEEHLTRTALGPERIASALVGTSAAVALGLGALGVYGVMADSVVQRRREIAVRLALGARGMRVIADVLRDGLRVAAAGGLVGLAAGWTAVKALAHAAPGFGVPSLWMWAACPAALACLVAAASVVPALRALAVDPLTLMREE